MKKTNPTPSDEMRPEYDFASMTGGVRGKYAGRAQEGTNIVLVQPEIADVFRTKRAVNEALKGVLKGQDAEAISGGSRLSAIALVRPDRIASRSDGDFLKISLLGTLSNRITALSPTGHNRAT